MYGDFIAIPVLFIIFGSIVMIIHIATRHKERMTMIMKGLTLDEIKAYQTKYPMQGDSLSSLKWGILFVFTGLAVLIGNFLHEKFYVDDAVIVGMVCIFAGIALLLFYGIAWKKSQQM
jgi:hypothetical protein